MENLRRGNIGVGSNMKIVLDTLQITDLHKQIASSIAPLFSIVGEAYFILFGVLCTILQHIYIILCTYYLQCTPYQGGVYEYFGGGGSIVKLRLDSNRLWQRFHQGPCRNGQRSARNSKSNDFRCNPPKLFSIKPLRGKEHQLSPSK